MSPVELAISAFPAEFGLRAFPGERFRISPSLSYVSDGVVLLYTEIKDAAYETNSTRGWTAFCKGTVQELNNNIVRD